MDYFGSLRNCSLGEPTSRLYFPASDRVATVPLAVLTEKPSRGTRISSDSYHCVLCERHGRTFNCDYDAGEQRTIAKILECYTEFIADFERHRERGTKQTINNVKGINSQFLLPIDPIRIIVPILHVPMGLVDKVLEHHLHWLQLKVEKLTGEEQMIRQHFRNSMQVLAISQRNLDEAKAQLAVMSTTGTKTRFAKPRQ